MRNADFGRRILGFEKMAIDFVSFFRCGGKADVPS